jgi:hypothetical protein
MVLAHRGDGAAVALATLLHRRGRCQVSYADDHDLARAEFVHRPSSGPIESPGPPAGDRAQLPGGAVIDANTDVVLCRLATLRPPRQARPDQQEYAEAEMFALALSWLAGLGDAVVNPPTPLNLSGAEPDLLRLHRLASGVGLTTPRLVLTSNAARSSANSGRALDWPAGGLPRAYAVAAPIISGPPLPRPRATAEPVRPRGSALVLGDWALDAPPGHEDRLVALVRAAGLAVGEVALAERPSLPAPLVIGLSAVPALTTAARLAALAGYLEQRAARRVRERPAA